MFKEMVEAEERGERNAAEIIKELDKWSINEMVDLSNLVLAILDETFILKMRSNCIKKVAQDYSKGFVENFNKASGLKFSKMATCLEYVKTYGF